MKLKHLLLSLSLAGLGFSQATAQETHSRHIGDGTSAVSGAMSVEDGMLSLLDKSKVQAASASKRLSDSGESAFSFATSGVRNLSDAGQKAGAGMDAAFARGAKKLSDVSSRTVQASGRRLSDLSADYATAVDMSLLAPTTASFSGSCDGSCGGGCSSCDTGGIISSGCDSGCDAAGSCAGGGNLWFGAETLLWFTQGLSSPPLVTTSNQGVFPTYGSNGVTSAFGGGDGIDNGLVVGVRGEAGLWLGDCKKAAIVGRGYGFEATQDYANSSNGDQSIGIPFFNVNPALLGEDAYLVAYTAPGNVPVSRGSVTVRSDLDLIGAEASLRLMLARSANSRVDLIGGYTYNRIKSSIQIDSTSENLFTGDLIPDGTVFTTNDLFSTENEFNGGHLGIISNVTRKGVSLQTLAKVSFGDMRQTSTISGYTLDTNGGAVSEGVFAYASNSGTITANSFAFIPELGIKLGYDASENLRLSVGYTFMYWSSVALAGEQMDRVIDPLQTVARPAPGLVDGSFYVQGIDLGATFSF